jgi:hypothetical protein
MDTLVEKPADAAAGPAAAGEASARAVSSAGTTARPAEGAIAAAAAGAAQARPTRRPIPPKLYKIGEVAGYAGTSRQTIHNYTIMGLIQESQWSQGGHRLYDETVFPRLDEILGMKAQRRSLKDIRESLLGRNSGS